MQVSSIRKKEQEQKQHHPSIQQCVNNDTNIWHEWTKRNVLQVVKNALATTSTKIN